MSADPDFGLSSCYLKRDGLVTEFIGTMVVIIVIERCLANVIINTNLDSNIIIEAISAGSRQAVVN